MRSRHLIGKRSGNSRVSSAITSLDIQTMEATTESGRIYRLEGEHGRDDEIEKIYSTWLTMNGWHHDADLTRALLRLLRMRRTDSTA